MIDHHYCMLCTITLSYVITVRIVQCHVFCNDQFMFSGSELVCARSSLIVPRETSSRHHLLYT